MSNVSPLPAQTPAPKDRGGIYSLPILGGPLSDVRDFYDEMEPTSDDSFGTALGKNIVRYGTVAAVGVAATGVAAIVCL